MSSIPKIIHQIWGGKNPIPYYFLSLSNTWKEYHPDWQYEFWDDNRIDLFVQEFYPHYWEQFKSFPQNMQRWDTVRYMILNKMGGIYVDFDAECIQPLDNLLKDTTCWFALEPEEYAKENEKDPYLSTALMGSAPEHPFIQTMIRNIFSYFRNERNSEFHKKIRNVIETTGPLMLTTTYENFSDKSSIYLVPRKYIAAYTHSETVRILKGEESDFLEKRIEEAYAVHYFFYSWMPEIK